MAVGGQTLQRLRRTIQKRQGVGKTSSTGQAKPAPMVSPYGELGARVGAKIRKRRAKPAAKPTGY